MEAGIDNPKSSSIEVRVQIQDVNDNVPQFPPSGYSITIKEGLGRREIIRVSLSTHGNMKTISCGLNSNMYDNDEMPTS